MYTRKFPWLWSMYIFRRSFPWENLLSLINAISEMWLLNGLVDISIQDDSASYRIGFCNGYEKSWLTAFAGIEPHLDPNKWMNHGY